MFKIIYSNKKRFTGIFISNNYDLTIGSFIVHLDYNDVHVHLKKCSTLKSKHRFLRTLLLLKSERLEVASCVIHLSTQQSEGKLFASYAHHVTAALNTSAKLHRLMNAIKV